MKLSALMLHGSPSAMLTLAPEIEAAGYHRIWIAENQPQPSTTLAASIVAGVTESIRVGTAAVLAHFYAPLAIAQDFDFLEMCYPDRIDLGFCSSWIAQPALLEAMLDGRDPKAHREAYAARVASLVERARKPAWAEVAPALWSMGTGSGSAALAAQHGLGFAYSVFHSATTDDPAIVESYRAAYRPHPVLPSPAVVIATAGICAETDAEARALAETWPNPHHLARIVGGPATCRAALAQLAERYRADEIVFADLVTDRSRRSACYRLLAGG